MISKQEVQHIAKLARLDLTDTEIEKMQKDLSAVLDYFEVLKKVPKSSLLFTSGQVPNNNNNNVLRKDEPGKRQISDKIIALAPDKKDNFVKVKTIL